MISSLGRYVFGLSAIGLGICTLIWPDFFGRIEPQSEIPLPAVLIDGIAVVLIGGGLAIQIPRVARAGAIALAVVYTLCTLLWLPSWIRSPLVFDSLGNAFEKFSMAAGALVAFGPRTARIGYYGFGVSVITFAVYQAVHLDYTASLVPTWIPPGQMFWSVATTIAFALAAVALLSGRAALLAAQLTTLMIVVFGLLIWVPATLSDPHKISNWAELCTNFGICGAAWIVADYLARAKSVARPAS